MELAIVIVGGEDSGLLMPSLESVFPLPPKVEVVVVDASDGEGAREMLLEYDSVKYVRCCSERRSVQMDEGARVASARVLLFLDVGEVLPLGYDHFVFCTIERPEAMLGCLSPTVGKKNLSCHCFESVVSFKKYSNSHRSFFIRRAAFLEAGAAAFC